MSMLGGSGSKIQFPKRMDDLLIALAPPTSGTKYEWSSDGSVANAVGTKKNVELISVFAMVTWTVQPTPLELYITIDGIEHKWTQANPVSVTPYYPLNAPYAAPAGGVFTTDLDVSLRTTFPMKGRAIKVEVETTGGTVQNLDARIKLRQIP